MPLDIRIVLVEPLYQGNVGSVARAMMNFGFSELVLVNPCDLDAEAKAMSSHAWGLLVNAKRASTLQEAIQGANLVIGSTGITGVSSDRHLRMPAYSPAEVRNILSGTDGVVALLFGREDHGFNREELKMCDIIMTIPTSDNYPVMNMSHAAAVVLYELSDIGPGEKRLAEPFDVALLYEHLFSMLDDIDYPAHKIEKTKLMLKRILGRAGLLEREVQTLRGILRRTQRKLGITDEC